MALVAVADARGHEYGEIWLQAGKAGRGCLEKNTARELQIATCGFHHTSQGILSFLIKMK